MTQETSRQNGLNRTTTIEDNGNIYIEDEGGITTIVESNEDEDVRNTYNVQEDENGNTTVVDLNGNIYVEDENGNASVIIKDDR